MCMFDSYMLLRALYVPFLHMQLLFITWCSIIFRHIKDAVSEYL
jgi:hypothetical protein